MTSNAHDDRNADQIAFWNGTGGKLWTERQEIQDTVLAPVSATLLERVAAKPGERILDVGCGCGVTSIELARQVGPTGHVLGIDVSKQMLARARERVPGGMPLDFVLADATTHPFVAASFDVLASRFGVMFFADPALSFANMRKGLRSGARVAMACWRDPSLNAWAMTPLQATYKHAPRLPQAGPEDSGLFSFANETRVRRILGDAGFRSVQLDSVELSFDMALGQGLDAAVETALGLGPSMRALKDQSPEISAAAAVSIREALAPLQVGNRVPLGATIWVVTAVNP
jgi:ubiquinone/menaquinone biosynthesis C-methylase UbiE